MILKLLFLAYFQDVVIESGIVSEGSIKGVLSGKHYNRSVSCHKVMYEALQRLRFQSFLDSITDENQELPHSLRAWQDHFQMTSSITNMFKAQCCKKYWIPMSCS